MVAVLTGGPVGTAAGVFEDVEEDGAGAVMIGELAAAADEWAAAESAATGLPPVVLHPVAASATTTIASTTPVAERFAILEAYVG
jgi:hypothetical protein